MLPRLLSLGWGDLVFHLNGYGFATVCGTIAALILVRRRAQEVSLPWPSLLRVLVVAVAGLFAGAKLAYALQFGRWGGWVFYGGLIGGTAAAFAVCRRFGLPALVVADLGVPCALVAAAFGRLGCFFAGCCFGTPWAGGLSYPAGSAAWRHQLRAGLIGPDALRSLPTVPAPLLESGALLLIAATASLVYRRGARPGRTLALCGLLYAPWRFVAEFWRGDHDPFWGPIWTFSQGISLVVLAFSAALLLRRESPRQRPAAPAPIARWHPALPVATILVGVAALTGGVGCSAKERYDAGDEIAEDCMEGCIDACCEAACDDGCGEKEHGPRTAAQPDAGGAPWRRLPPIEPTRRYIARLSAHVVLNETDADLRIEGTFALAPRDGTGTQVVGLEVSTLKIELATLSLTATSGDAKIWIDAKGRAVLRNTTLSPESISVLKALEPFSKGFLTVDSPAPAAQEWSGLIQRTLEVRDGRGECRGELVLDGQSYPFSATALINQTPDGQCRIQWLPRRTGD